MTDPAQAEREAIVAFMREAIAQGYDAPVGAWDLCSHGRSRSEDCIACYDDHLLSKLDAIERNEHHKAGE